MNQENVIMEGVVILADRSKVRWVLVKDVEDAPSNYYCMNAMQNYCFFYTKKREKAKAACDELYGKDHYALRTSDFASRPGKKVTARG